MAQINVKIPASHVDRQIPVDLDRQTPIHIMFQLLQNGDAPTGGSIWKMKKTGRAEVLNYFRSLADNGIADGDTVELDDFRL